MLWKTDAVMQMSQFMGVTYIKDNYASHVPGTGLNLI